VQECLPFEEEIMGAIYIILVVLAITSVALMGKISARSGVPAFDLTSVIFIVATVFGFFFAWSMGTLPSHYTPRLLVISALAGAGGAAAVFVFNLAIRIGHFGFSNAIYRSSFVIPVIYGIAFLGGGVDASTASGIAAILISIFLISWSNESFGSGNRPELNWFFLIVISFLLSGLPRIGQLLVSTGKLNSPAYLFASYAAGALLLSLMLLKKRGLHRRAWIYGSVASIASFIGVFSTIEALRQIPAAIVFPVTLSGPIILGLVISRIVYRERIRPLGLLGVLLGLSGIIVLALRIYDR
jgi:drug/metabolite transporter (DMT)-like permease